MNFYISQKTFIFYSILLFLAIVLGTIAGCKAQDGGIGLYTALAILTFSIFPYAKKIVLFIGRKAVDFSTTIDIIVVITILVVGIFCKAEEWGKNINYWWFVLSAFLYLVISVLKNYSLYLLIDIRDCLRKIAYGKIENKKINNFELQKNMDDTKICPNCGKTIKKIAQKCRFCGEWFNK